MSNAPRPGVSNPPTEIRRLDMSREGVATADDTAPAAGNPLNPSRVLVADIATSPQVLTLAHRLGRKPRGWIVSRALVAPVSLFEVSSDDRFLVLQSTGAAPSRVEVTVY